jgi:mRNA-degrading endonuclease toxin of MazEF toxin-antitoxin module
LIERGDIYFVDLDPTQDREQRGHRPVLVVTPASFNVIAAPLVAPITSGGASARHRGFTVDLAPHTRQVHGVVLCNQLRTLDLNARNGRFVERAPAPVVADVLAKIATLIA